MRRDAAGGLCVVHPCAIYYLFHNKHLLNVVGGRRAASWCRRPPSRDSRPVACWQRRGGDASWPAAVPAVRRVRGSPPADVWAGRPAHEHRRWHRLSGTRQSLFRRRKTVTMTSLSRPWSLCSLSSTTILAGSFRLLWRRFPCRTAHFPHVVMFIVRMNQIIIIIMFNRT